MEVELDCRGGEEGGGGVLGREKLCREVGDDQS